MKIEKNKVARFHYTLTLEDGETVDSSREREPLAYLHGAGNIVAGLEAELAGKEAGDQLTVAVPPEMAYGLRRDDAVQRVPMKHFRTPRKVKAGDAVSVGTERGQMPGTVVKVGRFHADVDLNHPLAGKTLNFEVEVIDVRDATQEEIAHGHAHGAGGHHHG